MQRVMFAENLGDFIEVVVAQKFTLADSDA